MKNKMNTIHIVVCTGLLALLVVFTIFSFGNAGRCELIPAHTAVSEELVPTKNFTKPVNIETVSHYTPTTEEMTEPTVPEPILWDDTVELTTVYHEKDEELMSYLLYMPTNIQDGQKLPLLIWMHGSGETNLGEKGLRASGLPSVLDGMEVPPNVFILCPQLNGHRDFTYWHTEDVLADVTTLIEHIISENTAIDADNVSIAGHSLGAIGCLHVAQKLPYIKRVACLSPYQPEIELTLEASNVRVYVGNEWYGEDEFCVYMAKELNRTHGYEVYPFLCSHIALPGAVFGANPETGEYDTFNWLLTN